MRSKWIVRNSSSKISNHSKSMLKSFYLLPTCISHCIELQYKPIWPIDTICRKNPNLFSNCMIGSCFPFIVDRYAVFMLTKCFAQWKLLSQALMFLMSVSFYVCLKKSCSAAFATALNKFSRTFCHTFNFINSSVLYLSRCFFCRCRRLAFIHFPYYASPLYRCWFMCFTERVCMCCTQWKN